MDHRKQILIIALTSYIVVGSGVLAGLFMLWHAHTEGLRPDMAIMLLAITLVCGWLMSLDNQ